KKIGVDPATFYRKKIGESDFYRREIQVLRKILNLTSKEVDEIFFDE
ncbi:toxin-antitoxin system, antitoxin component, Xre domain protein, partial [Candidatus Stoquefichus sp. KLE1796]